MRTLVGLVLLATAPALAEAQATKEDLKKLAKAGLSEDVILSYVRQYGFQGRLTASDLVELKDAGVGDRVLTGLLTPVEAPKAQVERSSSPSGTWSVSVPRVYPSAHYYPVYRPYYTGAISRGYYHRPYYRGYYRPYYYSGYYGPRYYGYSHCYGRVCW